jgi:hypothetical protein
MTRDQAIKKMLKAAHSPEARAKAVKTMKATLARKKAEKAAALQARFPIVPAEKAPVIEYAGMPAARRAYRKARDSVLPQDREEMVKAHLAIMLKLLHGE